MSIPTLRFSPLPLPAQTQHFVHRSSLGIWQALGSILATLIASGFILGLNDYWKAERMALVAVLGIASISGAIISSKTYRFPSVTALEASVSGLFLGYLAPTVFILMGNDLSQYSLLLFSFLLSLLWFVASFVSWNGKQSSRQSTPQMNMRPACLNDLLPATQSVSGEPESYATSVSQSKRPVLTFQVDSAFAVEITSEKNPVLQPARNGICSCESVEGRISNLHHSEDLFLDHQTTILYRFYKRSFDVSVILLSLPIILPLMGFLAILIRLDSPGSILFIQNRSGKNGRPFRMYKFRSMVMDAEARGNQFTQNNDVRVTKLGRAIRKYRFDELPQLWNVLKGEMSLIGPRPEQVSFVERFNQEIPFYDRRHLVKPGITGWAQVRQGYAAEAEQAREKLEYDFYYIKHCSILLDNLIVLKTFKTLFTGSGAR